jgi:hypothetical protein
MEKFSWKSTIKLNIVMFKLVGLWPPGENYKFELYTLYSVVAISVLLFGHVVFHTAQILFLVGSDLKLLIRVLFIGLTQILAFIKACFVIKNIKMLKHLMVCLESDLFQPEIVEQRELIQPDLNTWKTVHRSFSVLVLSTAFLFMAVPILTKMTKDHVLPFEAWYPYDTKKSPFYEITYVYQFLAITFRGVTSINVDTFIAALNTFVGTQCIILCDNLKNIKGHSEEVTVRKLKRCIDHHKEIVRSEW